jgi:hypothetical protein
MNPIPYQPLPVDTVPNCTLPTYGGWIQQIEESDPTQVQFTVAPCGSALNVFTNGTFVDGDTDWNPSGTWDFSGNKACSQVGSSDFIQQNVTLPSGYIMQFIIDVELFAGSVIVSTNLGLAGVINTSGETTIAVASNGITNFNIFVDLSSAACVRNIRLMPINNRWRVDLQTAEGDYVDTLTGASFDVARNFLTVGFNWNDLAVSEGCYRLAFFDPCECSQFGFIGDELEMPRQWQIVDGATATGGVIGGVMAAISFAGAAAITFQMSNVICPNVAYTFTYTLTGMSAGDEFRLRAGSVNGVLRTADGTYTETITSTHAGGLPFVLRAAFTLAGTGSFSMTDFSMEAVNPTPTYFTVPFQLVADGSCTTLFNACGNIDQFNMGFAAIDAGGNIAGQTGFSPRIRLEGTLRGTGYDGERSSYEFSTGRKVVTHMRTHKRREFTFYAPEYVHDFMNLMRGFDNVYINGDAVFSMDDEYPSMSTEPDTDMAAVTLVFNNRTELTENVRTTSLSAGGCSVNGTTLLTNRAQKPTDFNVQGGKRPFILG